MSSSVHPQPRQLSQLNDPRTINFYRHTQIEIVIKLILSCALATGAIAALVKLVPYHFSQQTKLREINAQVEETRGRVGKLKEELNRNFDPRQSQHLMEEYSPRLAPNQSRIFWINQAQE